MQSSQFFHGLLEDVHFADLLLEISQRRESGVLHISRHNIEKDIYFQEGHIVFAKSNDPDERLGELLLRRGKISIQQFEAAARKIVPGMRLGTILVQEGDIKPNDLYQGVIDQVEEILFSLFDWTEGEYDFRPGELPSKEVITLSISTADIIRTGIGRIWRWSWVKKGVMSLDAVFEQREMPAIAKRMMVTPGMQKLLKLLEHPMSLREILGKIGGNNFETCKMVWSLMIIGILEHVKPVGSEALETPMPEVTSDIFTGESAEEAAATVSIEPPVRPQAAPQTPATVQPKPAQFVPPESGPVPTVILDPATLRIPGVQLPVAPAPSVELSFSDFAELTDEGVAAAAAVNAAVAAETHAWERNIEKDVSDFNEKHRYLFEMLRIEMGAGVTNFLGKILKKVAAKYPMVFEGVQMNEFGELNATSLNGNIESNLVEVYPQALDSLLNDERTTIRSLLDKKRLDLIDTGITRIEESQRNKK